MRVALLSILFFALSFAAQAQSTVSFRLNLDPLLEEGLLSKDEQVQVYLRGSFNNWQGTRHELARGESGNLYTGSFAIEGKPGDTVYYKYVIDKGQEQFYWEDNPEPANPDHGNRRLVLKDSLLVLPVAVFHASEYFTFPVIFAREKLQADFQQFRTILEETHPALYDYSDKEHLDSLFDSNYAAIDSDMDFNSFLMLMTEIISQVGCGHSSLWIPGAYWTVAPERLFPLSLVPAEDKILVSGSFADSVCVPPGSEISSINGEPFEQIVVRLESLSSADGMIQAFRRAKVAQHFSQKYALAYGFPTTFEISYKAPGELSSQEAIIGGVSKEQVDRGKEEHNELSMKELDKETALLTINTFGYYGQVDMFKSFIDSVFRVIDHKGIENLIMDLRGNGGGDPFCSSYLWGYLQHEPSPYFEDHYGRYDTLANEIPQPARHFKGKLYTLIDGLGFSTTGHFCGLLKYHGVGVFVGSETGATFTCTGNATYPALDETGIMVGTARVMRYTAAVKNMDPRRGVIPDYPVESTQEDIISGRDTVLEYALSLTSEH